MTSLHIGNVSCIASPQTPQHCRAGMGISSIPAGIFNVHNFSGLDLDGGGG